MIKTKWHQKTVRTIRAPNLSQHRKSLTASCHHSTILMLGVNETHELAKLFNAMQRCAKLLDQIKSQLT